MIRSLRTRHRRMTTGLALGVPLFYVIALTGRGQLPPRAALPAELAPQELLLGDEAQLLGGLETSGLEARWAPGGAGGGVLELHALAPLGYPDLLVYATSGADWLESPPAGARLLGTFPGRGTRQYELALGDAAFALFSLGHGEVVASAAFDAQGTPEEAD